MNFSQASAQGGRQPINKVVCSDSDNGSNSKVAGKTTLTRINTQNPKIKTITSSKSDACVGAASVREYSCSIRNGQGVITSQVISCGSKAYCSKGACITRSPISQQVVSSTPPVATTPSTTPSSTPPVTASYYGSCIVRDSFTSAPAFTAEDVGEGYVKRSIPNISNYEQIARECTPAIYQELENRFCQGNRKNNQIHNYTAFSQLPDSLGTIGDSYGCPATGCNWRYCPGAVTSTPRTTPPTTTPSSTPPVAVASTTPPRLIPACETFFGCTVLGVNTVASQSTNIGEYHFDLRHPSPTSEITEIHSVSFILEGSYIKPASGDDRVTIDAYYGNTKVGSGVVAGVENGRSHVTTITFSPVIRTSDALQQSYFNTLVLKADTTDTDFGVQPGETKTLRPYIQVFSWKDPATQVVREQSAEGRDDYRSFTKAVSSTTAVNTLPMILITADAPVPAGSSVTQAILRGTQLGRFKVTNMGWVKATVEKIALADYGTHTGTSTLFDLVYSDQNSTNYTQNSVGTQNNLIFNNTSISIDGGAYRYITVVLKDLGGSVSGDSYGLYVHPGITSTFSALEYDLGFDYTLDGDLNDTAYGEIQGKPVLGAVVKY